MILALAPYGIYDALHGWPNLRAFWHFVRAEEGFLSWDALRHAFVLTGSAEIHTMAGARYEEYLRGLPRLWWLNSGMMGLLALALVYALVRTFRGPQEGMVHFPPEIGLHFLRLEKLSRLGDLAGRYQLA